MRIEGRVAPGFESVRALYEKNMETLAERNTQLCVYVGDACVVDLWASAVEDDEFNGDALVNVFSSGKSLEAILLATLVDRGLLEYDAPIADYWPNFANCGKDRTTVADLMRHEAGLAAFDTTLAPRDLHPERIQENTVGALVERQTQRFRPGDDNKREYHAVTRGWIANEIFRRVEPSGRTMGQFLRSEISEPLGADVYIALQEGDLDRVSSVAPLNIGFLLRQGLIPKAMGRKMELNLAQTIAKVARLSTAFRARTTKKAPEPITGMRKIGVVDQPDVAKAEIPSAGAKCSARGLAKLAAVMANGGRLNGRSFLSTTAYDALHAAPESRRMTSLHTTFTQGGLATFSSPSQDATLIESGLNRGREGYFGWMGLGGSIFQWHPDHRIGFAYVPTSLNVLDIVNERGKAYQQEVVNCVTASGDPSVQ